MIREAVGVLEAHRTIEELTYRVVTSGHSTGSPEPGPLTRLPAPVRLALKMVVHEDTERRAMRGELAELERRWREAEAIASNADALLVPADAQARLDALTKLDGAE